MKHAKSITTPMMLRGLCLIVNFFSSADMSLDVFSDKKGGTSPPLIP